MRLHEAFTGNAWEGPARAMARVDNPGFVWEDLGDVAKQRYRSLAIAAMFSLAGEGWRPSPWVHVITKLRKRFSMLV